MRHRRTCTDKCRPTAITLCSHDRKALELCRSYAQKKTAKASSPENSLATGGCFERNTDLLRYSARLVELDNSDFRPFQVATLK